VACAVTGRGFQHLLGEPDQEMLEVALAHAAVWARMAPDQKHRLMELLAEGARAGRPTLRHVAFCGDGANDVGALKVAFPAVQPPCLHVASCLHRPVSQMWRLSWE
jgi:magnesium-transporting ATPase (P-type)